MRYPFESFKRIKGTSFTHSLLTNNKLCWLWRGAAIYRRTIILYFKHLFVYNF